MKRISREPTVLLYHAVADDRDFPSASGTNIAPELFERQIRHLARNYSPIPLGAGGEVPAARPPLAVTFDDGYRDNIEKAYPVLARWEVPVTFFLTVSRIGRDWSFPGGRYPGISWEEVRKLGEDPRIDFGSHGLTHRLLPGLDDREATGEIEESRAVLEENLNRKIQFYSYTHGSYDQRIKDLVRGAGYRAAYSVISGGEDDFSRRRILISRKDNLFRFRLKLSRLYWPLRKIL